MSCDYKGMSMRIFLVLFLLSLQLMAVESFSIEVLRVEQQRDINDSFMDKVNATDLPFTTHEIEGKFRVLVGEFSSIDEAKKELEMVKNMVSKDAFITTGMAVVELEPEQKMIKAAIMAQSKALKKEDEEKSVEVKGPLESPVKVQENKKEDVVSKVYCKNSKKALREYEVSEALDFYKHSSFYSFKN